MRKNSPRIALRVGKNCFRDLQLNLIPSAKPVLPSRAGGATFISPALQRGENRPGITFRSPGGAAQSCATKPTMNNPAEPADQNPMFGFAVRKPTPHEFVHPNVDIRFRCPCCGYRTLNRPESLELCPVCWWEDDGQDDADANDVRLTVNGNLSLAEARMYFLQCGAAHPRFLPHVRKPQVTEQ